jgi:type IV pilus assembly protein PilA
MLHRLRERAGSEKGFTLIELLVVMLILGILAAIAIPSFLNQRNKATDSQAKADARSMQTAMETCGTDNGGSYSNCGITALRTIEPTIPSANATATPGSNTWTVSVISDSGNGRTFTISRNSSGVVSRSCAVPTGGDRGGCEAGNSW